MERHRPDQPAVSPPRSEHHDRGPSALSSRILGGTERSLRKLQRWPQMKEALDVTQIPMPAEQIVVFTILGTLFGGWLTNFPWPTAGRRGGLPSRSACTPC